MRVCRLLASKSWKKKLTRINRSTPEEIKELYKDILNHQEITEKGLCGLGIVLHIGRNTGHRIDFRFKRYDDLEI
ncbi:MAG: DUF6272 family protein [Bacteroidales bacterium]|nr:DUF6272 family protein [Bacteroidales bacterium]